MMKQRRIHLTLVAVIVLLLLPGLACNLLPGRSGEPVEVVEEIPVVEEPEVIEEPEPEEPIFIPQEAMRLDFEDKVYSVAVSKDGNLLATGRSGQVDVWVRSDGTLLHSFDTRHTVETMAFLPGDQEIVVGLGVYGVSLHKISDGEMIQEFHGGYNNRIALSPVENVLATGNRDGVIWVWDTSNGELIQALDPAEDIDGYSEWVTSLAYAPDGSIIAAGHWNGYIFLWDANSGGLIRTIVPETDYCGAWSLAFSPDGQYLAVGGHNQEFDNVIKVFRVADGSPAWVLDKFGRGGSGAAPVAFSPDGTLLAAGAVEGIYIWALPDYVLLHTIPIKDTDASDWVTDLAFSPDSQYLLASYWDNYAILWQVQE